LVELPEATASVIEALEAAPAAACEAFVDAMDDDFNTAGALAAIFDLVRVVNGFLESHGIGGNARYAARLEVASDTIAELLGVLGVAVLPQESDSQYPSEVLGLARDFAGYEGSDANAAVDALLAARAVARSERNWAAADGVRDGLAALGFVIEDTPSGARVSYRDRG
jgi:cysteinyl-tRNA synthetase